MKYIERIDLPEDYHEMMRTENHHDHKIIVDDTGVIRWEQDEDADRPFEELMAWFCKHKISKNHETYRLTYRNMGFSLSGYYDVFYCTMNNDICHHYKPPHSMYHPKKDEDNLLVNGSKWVYKEAPVLRVIEVAPSTLDDNGNVICIGTVSYINQYNSKCIKTITQFNNDYKIKCEKDEY
tara:strand:+ start:913 stop:1452 length:540 start_codon:yes stop_codon:yes gene_type:complete